MISDCRKEFQDWHDFLLIKICKNALKIVMDYDGIALYVRMSVDYDVIGPDLEDIMMVHIEIVMYHVEITLDLRWISPTVFQKEA